MTPAQRKILEKLATFDKPVHSSDLDRARTDVLERLCAEGLIDSQAPFRFSFYAVSITDAGRAALEKKP